MVVSSQKHFSLYNHSVILFRMLFILTVPSILFSQKFCSDNGDGTFTNPVIAADFPDPDVIRVDSVYYMVTTTMFIVPGVTILKSYDLVNWEYCSNAVQRFDWSTCYDLDGCNRYSHGQWATSFRYHNGTFYLLFITLDEGGFLCRAQKPEGPWHIEKLPKGFYDPGLFFDDDGRIYVAHGYNEIFITELDTSFTPKGNDVLVFTGNIRKGLEGTHVYKINGYYYLYCTYGGLDGFQVALRSKNIYGPYEQHIVIRDTTDGPTYGIHQGALIQTQSNEWWTILFVDSGPFGRFPSLQPVTWIDGWPMVGMNGGGVYHYRKPNVGKQYPMKILPTSDEFDSTTLGLQWGWNHNPEPAKWSLKERPGYLRLKTAKVVNKLPDARNTLTQRMFAYYSDSIASVAMTKIEFGAMSEGDIAGLAIFQDPYAYIGVIKTGGKYYVRMVNNGKVIDSAEIQTTTFYLQASAIFGTGAAEYYGGVVTPGSGTATFAYGVDTTKFIPLGDTLKMKFNLKIFTGNKFCLFNYATRTLGGHVDFDWFRTAAHGREKQRNKEDY